jgi:hypothetical protein
MLDLDALALVRIQRPVPNQKSGVARAIAVSSFFNGPRPGRKP